MLLYRIIVIDPEQARDFQVAADVERSTGEYRVLGTQGAQDHQAGGAMRRCDGVSADPSFCNPALHLKIAIYNNQRRRRHACLCVGVQFGEVAKIEASQRDIAFDIEHR
ncbi:hypothetical protein XcuCFBP2542_17720 [Xanthomonas cucurbitae]|uniref:Uncharacterized protein n=1 Tax=Xanthomonas cucurbitae TaxID=56453 RepID=A0A2S7DDL3_9XANT|nr:hypothetical protein XcuCFBP2542_17720 [Xanthomonas cucurbitae]